MMSDHPIQPIYEDHGILRFKPNMIVRHLLDNGGIDMNDIARLSYFSDEDRAQFAQLIGYSLSGFGDLNYVSDTLYETAEKMQEKGLSDVEARNQVLTEKLKEARDITRQLAAKLFRIHPDDLEE